MVGFCAFLGALLVWASHQGYNAPIAGARQTRPRLRKAQKSALRYDPVHFSPQQIECVARGFGRAVAESAYQVLACSILPEHVHLVVRRHRNPGERIIGHFKARATQQLIAENLHPFLEYRDESGELPPAWAGRGWKVFLNDDHDIGRAVPYVEDNPIKQGLPRQLGSLWFDRQPV